MAVAAACICRIGEKRDKVNENLKQTFGVGIDYLLGRNVAESSRSEPVKEVKENEKEPKKPRFNRMVRFDSGNPRFDQKRHGLNRAIIDTIRASTTIQLSRKKGGKNDRQRV